MKIYSRFINMLVCFLIVVDGFSQADSTNNTYKKWEVGADASFDFKYAYYTELYDSPHGNIPKGWVYGLKGSFINHSYGFYAKYNLYRFLAVGAGIRFTDFRIAAYGKFDVNYKDTIKSIWVMDYYTQCLEFPLNFRFIFFNKSFLQPCIYLGINNSFDIYEQAHVSKTYSMFYKNMHSGAYTIRGRLGAGLDFTFFKRFRIGADASMTTGPWWRSDKTMVKGIKYAVFSAGIHSGYLF